MKTIYILGAVTFIICTLGFVDVKLKFSDGTKFNYDGWNHLFLK